MRRKDRKAAAAPLTIGSNGHAAHANGHAGGVNDKVAAVAVPVARVPAGTIPPVAAEGRDGSGRFAPGNRGGPGSPYARAVAARRKALLDAVSVEDVARVGKMLYAQALRGDTAAAKVLLAYVVGKPVPPVDPDRVELEAFRLLAESPDLTQLTEACRRRVAPGIAAEIAEARAPATLAQLEEAMPKWMDSMEEEEEERDCLR